MSAITPLERALQFYGHFQCENRVPSQVEFYCTIVTVRRGFFYLLDYVTSSEIFQIGDCKKKKKTWSPFIIIFM